MFDAPARRGVRSLISRTYLSPYHYRDNSWFMVGFHGQDLIAIKHYRYSPFWLGADGGLPLLMSQVPTRLIAVTATDSTKRQNTSASSQSI